MSSPRKLVAAAILAVACHSTAGARDVWHVAQAGQGPGGDGRSWATAFESLQPALGKARAGDEIWVARGTYHPDPADRTASFRLEAGVAVYGGFAGSETRLDQRDHRRNRIILSGEIGKGDRTRNTITIVRGADDAVLDGFTIRGAYSTDEARMHLVPADIEKDDMNVGGGMRNVLVSPTVRNCTFEDNHSAKGGAVYNYQKATATQARFVGVEFVGNSATMRGGAVSNDLGAMPVFVNCTFLRNRSEDKGGGLYNDFAASPTLLNVLFEGNRAVSAGAIGNDGGSSPLLVHVTIRDNQASSGLGGGLYQGTGANNDPLLIGSVTDDVYSWHEDLVAALGSRAPAGQTLPLRDFIPMSNLEGTLTPADLGAWTETTPGYRKDLDGERLLANPLVRKLTAFYASKGGAVRYQGEYTRPAAKAGAASGPVVHVDAGSPAARPDGRSWATAYRDLQQAVDQAASSRAQVWIKAGTYAPGKLDRSRIAAFILRDDVGLYGGFAGTETALAERDPARNPTVLSARVAGTDERHAHVLYGANGATLDGLTIRDGRADGLTYQGKGGGLLAYHAGKTFLPHDAAVGFTMRIAGCRFEENDALEGGAIYAFGKARLTITDTVFERNAAGYGGALLDREGDETTCTRCTFRGNRARVDGGAAYADYGTHQAFSDVLFADNAAGHAGGAVYVISRASQLEATQVTIQDGRFVGNAAPVAADLMNLDGSEVKVSRTALPAGSVSGRVTTTGG